jgi:hypothetical protein
MKAVVADRVVLAGVRRHEKVQRRAADWGDWRCDRRVGLNRCDVWLRYGAWTEVARKRSPSLSKARGVHAWDHRHDISNVRFSRNEVIGVVGQRNLQWRLRRD